MAAFSGHREDGDELLGCCFSVAYSHVKERWWEERGEDEFPLLSSRRRGSLPPPRVVCSAAAEVQGRPVALHLQCNCETWLNKTFFFFSMSSGDAGDTQCWPPRPSPPTTLPPPPPPQPTLSQTTGTAFCSSKNSSHAARERMHLPLLPLTSFSHFAFRLLLATAFTDTWRVGDEQMNRRGRAWEREGGGRSVGTERSDEGMEKKATPPLCL